MPDLTLDLRYLKYAVQVAEAGSFRRAAERLSISQSTVSRRVQLFERNRSLSGVLCPPAPTRNNPSHIHQGGAGSDQGDSDQQQVAAA